MIQRDPEREPPRPVRVRPGPAGDLRTRFHEKTTCPDIGKVFRGSGQVCSEWVRLVYHIAKERPQAESSPSATFYR